MTANDHYDDGDPEAGEWGTPAWIWEPIADALGGFDLDAATNEGHAPIATHDLTPAENGLTTPWAISAGDDGRPVDVWVNPPYGREENPQWAEKFATEADRAGIRSITALVPAATGTQWWHRGYAQHADSITFIPERVTFTVIGGEESEHNATFGSAIVSVWNGGLDGDRFAYNQALRSLGLVLEHAFPTRTQEQSP